MLRLDAGARFCQAQTLCSLHAFFLWLWIAMRTAIISLLLTVWLIGTTTAQTVSGNYSLVGKNFDGSTYTGTVQITPNGSTCRIAWQTAGSRSEGMCMLSGNAFAAFYKLGSEYGLVIYELQTDGSLRGRWSVADKQGVGTELLVPQR
jgi:hypothetical protein